ncbi:hypothetical protein EWM64_g8229 [Hericium alpestre]|uniref:Uncharacterized protein n=1 Tax=Hericium alpestre TaxID=135208 RepID=A0A4Y9ZLX7_9AGAM|nr:hypothetical protein EWM64_g8229 [Hericium alpestre]
MFLICSTLVVIDFVLMLLTPDMTTNSFEVGGIIRPCATETASDLSQVLLNNLMGSIEDFLFATNILLADGLLIYRCFVLWKETRWSRCVVVLPILLLLASSATGYVHVYYDLEIWRIRRDSPLSEAIPPPNWLAFTELSSDFATATYIISLATTVLTTLLIVLDDLSGPFLMVFQGIAPTLIIVRLGLGKGVETAFRQPTASHISQVLSPTSRGNTFTRHGDDVESQHELYLNREQPSRNQMTDRRPSIEEVSISDRMPGFPPEEGAKLDGFNM